MTIDRNTPEWRLLRGHVLIRMKAAAWEGISEGMSEEEFMELAKLAYEQETKKR
jgi:hypothetical protein